MIQRILFAIAALICLSAHATDWDKQYISRMYDGRQLAPIEGVWRFPKDGATIAIVKSHSDTYDIYLIDSPRLDLKPGILIGTAVSTPKKGYYDGELNSGKLGKSHKLSSQKVTFTVNDGGTLSIKPYKTGYSLSFRRWAYYFLKVSLIDNTNKKPSDIEGARRIYPINLADQQPVCL